MVELFKNPRIDWIGAKKYFILLTIVLLVFGAASVELKGFNLGIDFAGGTLMTVRFQDAQPPERIRSVLGSVGIDTTKVIIQPVVNRPNELMIRTPRLSVGSEESIDADRREITLALQKLNPAGEVAAGKLNINTITAEGIDQELRHVDPSNVKGRSFPSTHPYQQMGDQVIAFRNGARKGFLQNIGELQGLTFTIGNAEGFDSEAAKRSLLERFYAGKIDINLAGPKEIEDALTRIDPMGIGAQENSALYYQNVTEDIRKLKKDRSGVLASLEDIQGDRISADLIAKMAPYFMAGNWSVISADIVGPQVGQDLSNRAIYVTLAALAGMLVYIAFRFEWIYGVAAVLAVFHDVMITLGLFSLFGWEISLTVVAALLTLIGYSMNDTIVIFDRIRENLRLRRRDSLVQITNDSINQTLSRTVIAAGLTFISVVAIVVFGGEVLRGFALALTVGIIIGTYSSIAVASPIMLWWQYLTSPKGAAASRLKRGTVKGLGLENPQTGTKP
ncbi:MAG TPA: protein translocase subunit SecF [Blastocatellia bacterium]|nr:protein translocase subunit SecF [Blastocatellia bacterium]